MNQRISGTFTVALQPQPWSDAAASGAPAEPGQAREPDGAGITGITGITPGRLLLDKHYQGELQGRAQGQMLSVMSGVQGSAGYVAMEVFTGTLMGRRGSFALQHSGTMNRGAPQLSVGVVPDSGTDELQGLSGRLDIRISEGRHFYDFDYTLP